MAYPPQGVDGNFAVPGVNAADNVLERDVVGNKADTAILIPDDISSAIRYLKGVLTKLANFQHEVEWATIPVVQQVASAAATNLTIGSITPTFPTGSTRIRAILVASIHAANQAANTHHVSLKVQGQKAAGGYGDLIDLTAQTTLGMVNLDGASDGWCGAIDVTTLVNASAAQYDFRFVVDSDNAGAVNYTTGFTLAIIYRI